MSARQSSRRPCIVVGAGLAGLTTAIFMRVNNIASELFEAAPLTTHIGGTITIFPNGMHVLRKLNIDEKIISKGSVIELAKFKDRFGNHMVNRPMGNAREYGVPTVTIKRSTLYDILQGKADELGVTIKYSKKVKQIENEEDKVTVYFEDGSSIEGDFVIGADGANSRIRQFLFGNAYSSRFMNLLYCGGYVTDDLFIRSLNLDENTQYVTVGQSGFFGYSYITNPRFSKPEILWYCYLPQMAKLSREELTNLENKYILDRVLSHHSRWAYPIPKIIESTSKICLANVVEAPPLPAWSSNRILVIGDAAHVMNPISGQGASTSFEDSFLLSKLLSSGMPYRHTFDKFEEIRRERVYSIARRASRSSRLSQTKVGTITEFFRNRIFAIATRLTPESQLNRYFRFNLDL